MALLRGKGGKFSLYFPAYQGIAGRDGFADDCLHRQLVYCFCTEILVSEIIAEGPQVSHAKAGEKDHRERFRRTVAPSGFHILRSAIPRSGQLAHLALSRQVGQPMPAILEPKGYERWLGLEPDPHNLLITYPSEPMTMWPISTRVNSPDNDDVALLELFEGSLAGKPA